MTGYGEGIQFAEQDWGLKIVGGGGSNVDVVGP